MGTVAFCALVLFDCVINALLGGAIDETLSSRAHRMRGKGQKYWGWAADAIDLLFFWQDGHCRRSWELHEASGGSLAWVRSQLSTLL